MSRLPDTKSALALSTRLIGAVALSLACTGIGSDSAHAEPRVLARDSGAGGPARVALANMGPLFDDPTIEAALRSLERGRPTAAIGALRSFLAADADSPLRGEATVALGYALHVAGEREDALDVLADCPEVAPLFADHCLYWAALTALDAGEPAAAEAFAALVDETTTFGPRARHLRGRALAVLDRHDDAVRVFEQFLASYPSAAYRNDVEFDLAASYVALERHEDAARIYRRVSIVNPGSRAETRAQTEMQSIEHLLDANVRASLGRRSSAETLDRARVLFDRHRSDQVIALLDPVVAAEPPGSVVYCEAAYLVARSYTKLRQHRDGLPPYRLVIDNCEDEDLVVRALYNAGRGSWNVDLDDDAIAYFQRLWTDHASSTYADDAFLLAARVHRSNDRIDDARALLERQIVEHPTGDMLGEAVWLLASSLFESDPRALVRFVEDRGSLTGERDIYSRGRLGYFRARSLEQLSMRREARNAYADVVRANPMAYYALLAVNRLYDIDPDAAIAVLDEVVAEGRSSLGSIEIKPAEAAHDPFFRRGSTLLRMGLFSLAESEFGKLRSRFANEDEIGWVVSLMYHRVGAFHLSHHVPGGRLDLNLDYPNDDNRERWQVAYPMPFDALVREAAEAREIDVFWVYSIMREESGFRADVESWANARGLLQLMEGTANDMARMLGRSNVRTSELFDPATNIELGTMFMKTLSDRYQRHPTLIFAGYNGGHGNVGSWLRARGQLPLDLWVEEIPFEQTRNYTKRVTMSFWVYSWLYGGTPMVRLPWQLVEPQ